MFLLLEKGYSQVETSDNSTDKADEKSANLTSPNKDFEKRTKIKPIAESENDVEIRFYVYNLLTRTSQLKILSLKDGNWKGTLYNELNHPIRRIRKFKLKSKNGFEELYKSLLQNNLTKLPSQDELKQRMRKVTVTEGWEVEHKFSVTDGQSYTVEYKISGNSRIFAFYNPKPYAEFYSDVQELKDYVKIKSLFETELKKK